MKEYSTEEIVRGIAGRKDNIIRHVYKTCYPDIRKLILGNSGKEHDVQDLFQEAMILVFQKITGKGLCIKCSFNTYMYSVCRFLWLKELENRRDMEISYSGIDDVAQDSPDKDRERESIEVKIYERHFEELGKDCQKVLNMYFNDASMEEIAVVMGYSSVQIARDKKYKCKKSLTEKISNNPEYKRLQNEIYLAG